MREKIIVGIDTSNYTTSLALMTPDGELIANIKKLLPVKAGECGLRQSDAVFAHVKNLPDVIGEAEQYFKKYDVAAVGVSERPRNIDGSYMPCFLCGVSVAEAVAKSHSVPLYKFSHQCGHIMAALYSAGAESLMDGGFAAFHISGGTTELLDVVGDGIGFKATLVGGTKDLNAGQIIDRIGVHLGLPFPAGPHLEKVALQYNGKVPRKKPSVDGTYANLSGLENMAVRMYKDTEDPSVTAAFVFDYLGDSILTMCKNLSAEKNDTPFVFAGGVMCNSIIKRKLTSNLNAYFADPMMSADNAVGIARLATLKYNSNNG